MSINLSVPNNASPELKPKITIVGVGGAGGNAISNMIQSELEGTDFVVCNTDAQALSLSRADHRIQLGAVATAGLGAGSQPNIGRVAAEEALEEIMEQIGSSHMIFIAAGMGGGTGTGAAPVVAKAARESGILTVGVVTKPFQFEGGHRMAIAEEGIKELEQYVDTLIVIPNQNLFRIANERTTFADAFKMADDVLYRGVKGVTDLMVMPGLINLDFADIRSVMAEMGKAMMGTGEAEGERRALDAAEAAIANPLLDDSSMKGARGVLINITGGSDITLFEVDEAANRVREEVDKDAYIIIGSAFDSSLEGMMRVSVVATGIDANAAVLPRPGFFKVTETVISNQPTRAYDIAEESKVEQIAEPVIETAEDVAAESQEEIIVETTPEVATVDMIEAEVDNDITDEELLSDISQLEQTLEQSSAPEKVIEQPLQESVPQVVIEEVAAESAAEKTEPAEQVASAKPVSAQPVAADPEEKQIAPASAPSVSLEDAFIPPRAAVSTTVEDVKPDPFAEAAFANGSSAKLATSEESKNKGKHPSIFAAVKRKGREFGLRVTGDSTSADKASAVSNLNVTDFKGLKEGLSSGLATPNELPGLQKTASTPQPQPDLSGMEAAQAEHLDEADDNSLEIPAFLRRQAN